MKLLILVLSCLIQSIYSVPPVNRCKANDKKCLLASSQALFAAFIQGLAEYGIPAVYDHMYLEKGKSESPGLSIFYKNVNVYGFNKAKVVHVLRDESNIEFDIELPLEIKGQYELKGKILILEVVGKGNVNINTDKIRFRLVLKKTNVKGTDGEDHWKITGFEYEYDLLNKVNIDLDGLFNGDEEKAKLLKELMNTNYEVIIDDIGKPIMKDVLSIFVKHLNNMLRNVPSKDLEIV